MLHWIRSHKGILEPTIYYKGEPNMDAEWRAKLLAYFRAVASRRADQWIAWAGEQDTPIVEQYVGVTFGDAAGEVKDFSIALHAQLVSRTTGYP